jgi:adenine deaminase
MSGAQTRRGGTRVLAVARGDERGTAEIGGGQVAVLDGQVLAEVPLPIGGLMCDRSAGEVAALVEALAVASHRLGVTIEAPFMQLSFLGLSVIPALRLTDRGLVDVNAFGLTDVAAVPA